METQSYREEAPEPPPLPRPNPVKLIWLGIRYVVPPATYILGWCALALMCLTGLGMVIDVFAHLIGATPGDMGSHPCFHPYGIWDKASFVVSIVVLFRAFYQVGLARYEGK